jgi:hypothetical protein
MNEELICRKIKCSDYLADDGEPAWCRWACFPAKKAVNKCPKVTGQDKGRGDELI